MGTTGNVPGFQYRIVSNLLFLIDLLTLLIVLAPTVVSATACDLQS